MGQVAKDTKLELAPWELALELGATARSNSIRKVVVAWAECFTAMDPDPALARYVTKLV